MLVLYLFYLGVPPRNISNFLLARGRAFRYKPACPLQCL